MFRRIRKKHALIASIAGSLILACLYLVFNSGIVVNAPNSQTCHIRLLDLERRVNLRQQEDRSAYEFRPNVIAAPPIEQSTNPILFSDTFAVVQFENKSSTPLTIYVISSPLILPDRPERSEDYKAAFLVTAEVRGPDGSILKGEDPQAPAVRSFNDLTIPSAAELVARKPARLTIQPTEPVELPFSILGKVQTRSNGLKPGTYTVRAVVSYAEAPSGETRQITSEPVTITVTEEHIKAAEAYWASVRE